MNVQGQTVQKEIELSATSVDFFVFIIDEHGNQSTNFDFGDVYYGQKGVIETYLVNNSPKKYTFRTKFLQGVQTSFVRRFNPNGLYIQIAKCYLGRSCQFTNSPTAG